jgi:hypothetical protein
VYKPNLFGRYFTFRCQALQTIPVDGHVAPDLRRLRSAVVPDQPVVTDENRRRRRELQHRQRGFYVVVSVDDVRDRAEVLEPIHNRDVPVV